MILAIVLASYKTGGVIFQRYYGSEFASEEKQARFLLKLRNTTAFEWPSLVADHPEQVRGGRKVVEPCRLKVMTYCQLVDSVCVGFFGGILFLNRCSSNSLRKCAFMEGIHVMYKLMGDVVLTLAGDGIHDQLLLLEFSRAFDVVIRRILRVKNMETISLEARLLQSYSKLCMVVEEMIFDGEIDQLDVNMIDSVITMKA